MWTQIFSVIVIGICSSEPGKTPKAGLKMYNGSNQALDRQKNKAKSMQKLSLNATSSRHSSNRTAEHEYEAI